MKIAKWEILKIEGNFVSVKVSSSSEVLEGYKANADFFAKHAEEDKEEWWEGTTDGVIPEGIIRGIRAGMVIIQFVECDKYFHAAKNLTQLAMAKATFCDFTKKATGQNVPDAVCKRII